MPAEAAEAPHAWQAASAKVNLFLHVTGRRPDGYHALDSLAVFAGAADMLRAEPAGALSLDVSGPFGAALSGDNLVLRAARALAEAAGVPARARLTLDKRLPVASGIGGGSADAAAALRLLSRLWGVDVGPAAMAELARALGADVPVCLASRAARMGGAGEALSVAPCLPECGMALVNPGAGVATADVFRARSGPFTPEAVLPAGWPDARAMADGLRACRNDLQAPALALCPAIGDVLAALDAHPGCLLARMSGSGATCFGLFASAREAEAAAGALARPGWWAWGGAIG